MRWMWSGLGALALAATAMPAGAQEIVVTGSRLQRGLIAQPGVAPTLMLRRTADFAVQRVTITDDTRDPDKRHEEIYAMVKAAIAQAEKSGVQLATGETVVEPLTLANYRNLTLEEDDDRDDTEQVTFLIKVAIAPGVDTKVALDRITKFTAAVPTVGRAEIVKQDDLSLSVVQPEQYRGDIVKLVAAETTRTAGAFGDGYGVEVNGMTGAVQWARASLTEVFLYLPVSYSVVPRR